MAPVNAAKSTSGPTPKRVTSTLPERRRVCAVALQAEVCVGGCAEAVVADADVVAFGGEVGEEAFLLVAERAADAELAAAGGADDVPHFEAVLVEGERAVEIGEAVGHAIHGDVDVDELNIAGELRVFHASIGGDLEGDLAGGDDVGVEGVRERHADAAVGVEIERTAVGVGVAEDADGAAGVEVSVLACDVELVEGDGAVAEAGAERLGGFELDAFELDVEGAELGRAGELRWAWRRGR